MEGGHPEEWVTHFCHGDAVAETFGSFDQFADLGAAFLKIAYKSIDGRLRVGEALIFQLFDASLISSVFFQDSVFKLVSSAVSAVFFSVTPAVSASFSLAVQSVIALPGPRGGALLLLFG